MITNINYWTQKDSELVLELDRRDIDIPGGFSRRAAIDALKLSDASGEIKETKDYVEKLKEEQPTLEVRKVIFHSVGEQDIPYVFVGHNGRAYYLPKEQPIDVPVYILNSCIKDAVEDRMLPQVDTQGNVNWVFRKVQRYPYSYVD